MVDFDPDRPRAVGIREGDGALILAMVQSSRRDVVAEVAKPSWRIGRVDNMFNHNLHVRPIGNVCQTQDVVSCRRIQAKQWSIIAFDLIQLRHREGGPITPRTAERIASGHDPV